MRKIALVLLLILLVVPCSFAEPLPIVAKSDTYMQLERYQSFDINETIGEWSAHGLIAQQILSTLGQSDVSTYMDKGLCVLYPGVRGNRDLSLMEPVLFVCLLRNSPIKADALSITTGGARYDFVGKVEDVKIIDRSDRKCEQFTLPLDAEGLTLLKSFAREGGKVRIYGETQVYRTDINESASYKTSKQRVEAMSVAAVQEFLAYWPEDYALWDLNEHYWDNERPRMASVKLAEHEYSKDLPKLESSTQCLDTQKGAAVKAYQQLLKDKAFLTGKPDTNYGKATRASTKQAQQYYGLLPTGMADKTLIELLTGGAPRMPETQSPKPSEPLMEDLQAIPGTAYTLAGQLSIRLDRAWLAQSLSPLNASEVLDRIFPADRSNRLYIADGELVNLSDRSFQTATLLQGYVQLNEISYPCILYCERDKGTAFGASLLPMGESRLVITCEMPEGIELADCALHIVIQGAAEKIEIIFGM